MNRQPALPKNPESTSFTHNSYVMPRESNGTLICALASDEKIREMFSEGLFAFVDSHICINSDKYIEQLGRDELTDYAKKHMDECRSSLPPGVSF